MHISMELHINKKIQIFEKTEMVEREFDCTISKRKYEEQLGSSFFFIVVQYVLLASFVTK